MTLNPIKPWSAIRAPWLNELARTAMSPPVKTGYGSGIVASDGIVAIQPSYLTAMFKASEDFEEEEDIYKGNAKMWWRIPGEGEYQAHGDDLEVWSHEDGVKEDDIFPAFFNQQSGRWEKIGGGACQCAEVDEFYISGSPVSGSVDILYVLNGSTGVFTVDWDTSAVGFAEELSTHPQYEDGDAKVIGGPWPIAAIYVIWGGEQKGKAIQPPSIDHDLEGTGAEPRYRKASSVDWNGY